MIIDAMYNPPIPDWNELSNDDIDLIEKAWDMFSCPHACSGDVFHFYEAIRTALKERELRFLKATMDGPP